MLYIQQLLLELHRYIQETIKYKLNKAKYKIQWRRSEKRVLKSFAKTLETKCNSHA